MATEGGKESDNPWARLGRDDSETNWHSGLARRRVAAVDLAIGALPDTGGGRGRDEHVRKNDGGERRRMFRR